MTDEGQNPFPTPSQTIDAFSAILRQGYKYNGMNPCDVQSLNDIPLAQLYRHYKYKNGLDNGRPIIKVFVPDAASMSDVQDFLDETNIDTMSKRQSGFSVQEIQKIKRDVVSLNNFYGPYFSIQTTNHFKDADILFYKAFLEGKNKVAAAFASLPYYRDIGMQNILGINAQGISSGDLKYHLEHEFLHNMGIQHLHDHAISFNEEQLQVINTFGNLNYELSIMYYDAQGILGEAVNDVNINDFYFQSLGPVDRMQIEYGLYCGANGAFVKPEDFVTAFMAKEYSYAPFFKLDNLDEKFEVISEIYEQAGHPLDMQKIKDALAYLQSNRSYSCLLGDLEKAQECWEALYVFHHDVLGFGNVGGQANLYRYAKACGETGGRLDFREKEFLDNMQDLCRDGASPAFLEYKNDTIYMDGICPTEDPNVQTTCTIPVVKTKIDF